jgi:hypothetical protein
MSAKACVMSGRSFKFMCKKSNKRNYSQAESSDREV